MEEQKALSAKQMEVFGSELFADMCINLRTFTYILLYICIYIYIGVHATSEARAANLRVLCLEPYIFELPLMSKFFLLARMRLMSSYLASKLCQLRPFTVYTKCY